MNKLKQKNILLVEDQILIAMNESHQLREHGYNVIHVLSGEKAIDTVQKAQEPFDLILMDIDLGKGIDGTQAAQEIQKVYNIPVLFLSSHTEKDIVEKTEKITSYGYVAKDSGITVLDASIKMAFKLFEAHKNISNQQDALQQSEKTFRGAFETAAHGMAIVAIDGNFLRVNQALCDIVGYNKNELEKIDSQSLTHSDDLHADLKSLQGLISGEEKSYKMEKRYYHKLGHAVWVLLSVSLVSDKNNKPINFVSQVIDINGRKLAEQQNEYERKNKEALINNTEDLIWSVNNNFELIASNNAFINTIKSHTGITIKTGDGLKLEQFFSDGALDYWKKLYIRAFSGESVIMENYNPEFKNIPYSWRENKINPIYDGCNIIGVACYGRDITEKKRQEKLYILENEIMKLYSIKKASIEKTIDYLLNGIREIHPSMLCSVLRLKNNRLYNWSSQQLPKDYNDSIEGLLIGMAQGSCGTAAYSKEKIIVTNISTDPLWANYKELAEKYELRACWSHPILDFKQNVLATFAIYHKTIRNMSNSEELTIERAIIILKNIIENKISEEALAESIKLHNLAQESIKKEQIFSTRIISAMRDGFAVIDYKGTQTDVNQSFCEMTGFSRKDLIGIEASKYPYWPPEEFDNIQAKFKKSLELNFENFELIFMKKNGQRFPVIVSPAQLVDDNGNTIIFATIKDITEHKIAKQKIQKLLEEKELFLKEVHHRTKNNMNTMLSLLSIQSQRLTEPSAIEALKDAGERMRSMMVLYDKLYITDNFKELSIKDFFVSLIDQIIKIFPNSNFVKIIKNIDDFILNTNTLLSLGIMINELITNSMKHAFDDNNINNEITISASLKDNNATLIFHDNGKGLDESVDLKTSLGFGLILVDALTKQIGGQIKIERYKGTKFIIEFIP
ncbi:MAG: PAS domain S-box protein [Candidatus Sericytochromatia bacterium]|nr:PAS domain S-box protein [Candidatus Sericytochromatia bacterium]